MAVAINDGSSLWGPFNTSPCYFGSISGPLILGNALIIGTLADVDSSRRPRRQGPGRWRTPETWRPRQRRQRWRRRCRNPKRLAVRGVIYIHIKTNTNIRKQAKIDTYIRTYMYTYVYTYMYTCMYTYIIDIYTYVHMHTSTLSLSLYIYIQIDTHAICARILCVRILHIRRSYEQGCGMV